MKALVIYDSVYGNTERIAQAIATALGSPEEVTTLRAGMAKPERLAGAELVIVGSPTQRMRPIPPVSDLLAAIPRGGLRNVKAAAFDTRIAQSEIDKVGILAFFVRIFGFAADTIAGKLRRKGATLVAPPQGFIVQGTEGPLQAGELERAAEWAKRIATA
jgi:flavodoxin